MSRRISLNARLAQDGLRPEEIEVILFRITHADLVEGPIRLSTDNTERISDDPLVYGTRSGWGAANPATDPYLWVIASAVLPGDAEDTPASAQVVLDNLDARIVEILRSFTTPAEVDMAVVLASSPDIIENEWLGLLLTTAEGDDASIIIQFDREEIEAEYFPSGRMTRHRFPGLFL